MFVTVFLVLLAVCSWQSNPFAERYCTPASDAFVKTVDIHSSDPAQQEAEGVKIWRFDIEAERCVSARFNFKPFDMAQGDYIVIYGIDANGQQIGVQRYEGKGWREEREVNSLRFSAKEAVLEVHIRSPKSNFRLNYVHYADCFQERPGLPQAVCGTQDWDNIICYNTSQPNIYALRRSVFKLTFVQNGSVCTCTAWKVSTDGRFMTAGHCLEGGVPANIIELSTYESTQCKSDTGASTTNFHGNSLLQISSSLDYAIFTVRENTGTVQCLRRTNLTPDPTTGIIYLIHHPRGLMKKISLESDMDHGDLCRRAPTCTSIDFYCYMCDTDQGSSGAPVFIYSNTTARMFVFALHSGGNCPNEGVKMSLISGAAGSVIGTCT